MLWEDMRTAPRAHVEVVFAQRRNQIIGDCRQLKADVDSFNDPKRGDNPIQMIFNFTNAAGRHSRPLSVLRFHTRRSSAIISVGQHSSSGDGSSSSFRSLQRSHHQMLLSHTMK